MDDGTFDITRRTDNVVRLADYRPATLPDPIRQVEAYWHALRRGRLVPRRADVDPRGISGALGQCFLLERIAPGLARIRVSGRLLSDMMGLEVQGLPFSAMFEPDTREAVSEALREVFETPSVAMIEAVGRAGFARSELKVQIVLMPLASDLGDISRALGCIVIEGTIGRTPRRLTIRSLRQRALTVGPTDPGDLGGDRTVLRLGPGQG